MAVTGSWLRRATSWVWDGLSSWWALVTAVVRRCVRGTVGRLLAAAVLLAVAVTGIAEAATRGLSGIELILIGLAVVLGVTVLAARRSPRILPFKSVVRGDGADACESLAGSFAVHLACEIERISRARQGPPSTDSTLLDGAGQRGETPVRRGAVDRFTDIRIASGTDQAIEGADVGSLDVGPLRIPVGSLLDMASRVVGRAISGHVVADHRHVRVVATYSGHPKYKWSAEHQLDTGDQTDVLVGVLARDIAYQVVWDLDGSSSANANWQSFGNVIEGLEHFKHYRTFGEPDDLVKAESSFVAAIAISPHFAVAYHDLALVHAAKVDTVGVSGEAQLQTAVSLWRRAVELDAELAASHLELARSCIELGDRETAVASARRSVALARKSGHLSAVHHYWLGQALLMAGDPSEAEDAAIHLNTAYVGLRRLRRRLKWDGASQVELAKVDGELAAILVATARALQLVSAGDERPPEARPSRHRLRRRSPVQRAETALRSAVKKQPNEGFLHGALGSFLASGGRDEAVSELVEALRLEPTNTEILCTLGAELASRSEIASHDAAAAAYRIALALDPREPEPWAMLGQYAASIGDTDSALELAWMSVVLRPDHARWYWMLADIYQRGSEETGTHEWADALRSLAGAGGSVEELRARIAEGSALPVEQPHGSTFRAALLQVQCWLEIRVVEAEIELHPGSSAAGRLAEALTELDGLSSGDLADAIAPEGMPAYEIGRLHAIVANAAEVAEDVHRDRAIGYLEAACDRPLLGGLLMPPQWMLDLADAYVEAEHFERAVEQYTRVLAVEGVSLRIDMPSPTGLVEVFGDERGVRARALAGRGDAYAGLADDEASRCDCESAIALEPLYAFPHLVLAQLFSRRGEHDRVIASWHRFEQLLPTVPVLVHENIGRALLDAAAEEAQGSDAQHSLLRRALDEFTSALLGSSDRANTASLRAARAGCFERLGANDRALLEWERAAGVATGLDEEPDHLAELATRYERARQWNQAESTLQRVVELQRKHHARNGDGGAVALAESLNALAWFLGEQSFRLDHALSLANEAVEFVPDGEEDRRANFLDTRGWLRSLCGDLDGGIADLDDALQTAVPTSERRAHLAFLLEARAALPTATGASDEDLVRARREWRRIVDLDPDGEWGLIAKEHSGELAAAPGS